MEKKLKKKDWQQHLEKAAVHPQGVKGYCRDHSLANSSFHYWKKKFSLPKTPHVKPFAAVELVRPATQKLPDPKWLAEFLLCLSGAAR